MRAPWSTPTSPAQIVAACRAVSTPSPPASKPKMSTDSSSRKAVNMPIALEPPPTQAATASGSAPVSSRHWARASSPIPRQKSRTIAGNGCGPAAVPKQ